MSSLLWVFNNISLIIQPVAYTDYVVPACQVPSSPGTNVMVVLSLSKFKHYDNTLFQPLLLPSHLSPFIIHQSFYH